MTGLTGSSAMALGAGWSMSAAVVPHAQAQALIAAVLSAAGVFAARWSRVAVVCAVQGALLALALGEPTPVQAGVAGVGATVFVLAAHSAHMPGIVVTEAGLVLAVAAATAVAAVSVFLLPFEIAWLPLVAPIACLAVYAVVLAPYTRSRNGKGPHSPSASAAP
ncbi:hypothetical protein [Rhodococcus maanshanensis]|uniref:Integral membrane protein n=1 Tax=Rhodococcus maanshanensis TaxID=183556 RepID=A0A1H7YCC0_9NOCA|nr:hypothetical protein [Rhodococcus maanshanensis]SEM42967.1 hypothetical protein SAMN05444583_1389 [Rhodococcus maanshanensis]